MGPRWHGSMIISIGVQHNCQKAAVNLWNQQKSLHHIIWNSRWQIALYSMHGFHFSLYSEFSFLFYLNCYCCSFSRLFLSIYFSYCFVDPWSFVWLVTVRSGVIISEEVVAWQNTKYTFLFLTVILSSEKKGAIPWQKTSKCYLQNSIHSH